ncbi:nucleotidyl transferase AbiEii/AbiGii toxin family protein [Pseudomarimonas salicorniae]|uniref:Nucleotidyl transferase AbiEii/AbiGii toxin family protein n=1 Tax=Pseudomarimonas salicorniae TaxID=2933270 RepID=A0ABT0GD77_9GAMM|nr:nucleotidyl transferase AbiEii/AbiGii toxin family protein [Lysobacter sp. CAU 1642]MCK7592292.1 nucleotidyl transferase AbiEii/AbiGii toxin family protein [Lysobacter sp. CAU 1642]
MTNFWHDFSQQAELVPVAPVIGAVTEAAAVMGIGCLIAGAFARDLLLHYRYGIPTIRKTDDLDFGLSVGSWSEFESLKDRLIAHQGFKPTRAPQRLRHPDGHLIDIVPFGAVETADRALLWPPEGDPEMDVFGFREALGDAHTILLPGKVRANLVSLPALTMLKLVCWKDRHRRKPGKDAADLALILGNYLEAGNADRLYEEFGQLLEDDNFEYEHSGPRMLGHDVRQLLDVAGRNRLDAILVEQCSDEVPGVLPSEMNRNDPDRARAGLKALRKGLREAE